MLMWTHTHWGQDAIASRPGASVNRGFIPQAPYRAEDVYLQGRWDYVHVGPGVDRKRCLQALVYAETYNA